MIFSWFKSVWNRWVLLAALAGLVLLCGFWWLAFWVLQPPPAVSAVSTAVMTIIPAPTITPTQSSLQTPTPQPDAAGNGIAVGVYVQIFDTGSDGLRLRSGAGTGSSINFIGLDGEVFQVKDGPQEADGHTWWYLVAPYDSHRSGWASSRYLEVVTRSP